MTMKKLKKNQNLEKSKLRLISPGLLVVMVLMVLGLLAGVTGCKSGMNRTEVVIEINNPSAVEFNKYDKVYYQDLSLESMPGGFNPEKELRIFFLEELSSIIEKKIERWDKGNSEPMPARSVLITGKLKLDVKERSRIQDVDNGEEGALKGRDGSGGKKKRVFVSVQHWDMTFSLVIRDVDAGKEVFKDEYTAKLTNAVPDSTKYNFEDLFFKVSNRLVNKLVKTRKMQRRYLLF